MVKNLKQLIRKFNSEDKCREFLVQQRWNGKPVCPHCGHTKVYTINKGRGFKCANSECYKKFTATVGTVFEASNIPLSTWFPAVYIITSHKKGISSVQLAKDLGVTQKTAWFMIHRIRESLKENNPQILSGVVEIDETYMSRKFGSAYKAIPPDKVEAMENLPEWSKKRNLGAVIGMIERKGNVRVFAADKASAANIGQAVTNNVAKDTLLFTDESNKYVNSLAEYDRQTVNHSKGEWVRGIVHTNNMEAFWSVLKRGVYGIYHQISYKHLQRYCDEFSYRYNSRKITDGERFSITLKQIEGRLTYKHLVHGKNKKASKASQRKGI